MNALFIGLIIFVILIGYAVCTGAVIAICKYSKLYTDFCKNIKKYSDIKQLTGALILFSPISLILFILAYIGCGAYHLTIMLCYLD